MQHKQKSSQKELSVQSDKVIRGISCLNDGNQLAIITYAEVLILDIQSNQVIKIIKRAASVKSIVVIPKQSYIIIHYSDNFGILYDTHNFEQLYIIMGLPNDHQGIKPSENGQFLLYGSGRGPIQLWNISTCNIEFISNKIKSFNTYEINHDGSELYFGTYQGQIIFVKLATVKQTRGGTVRLPIQQPARKVHNICVIGIQYVNSSTIATIDFSFECAIIFSSPSKREWKILCKIDNKQKLTKNITFAYSKFYDCLYVNINDCFYKVGVENGQTFCNTLDCQHKSNFLVPHDRQIMMLASLKNNYTFQLNYI